MKREEFLRKKDIKDIPILKPPYITMLPEVYAQMHYLVSANKDNYEIMFFAEVEKQETDSHIFYLITKLHIPPQTSNRGTFVTTDDEKYHNWLLSMPRETRQKLRCHIHSHPKMGTSPSGTDVETMNEMVENIDDFYIRIIVNEKHFAYVDLFDIEDKKKYSFMDLYIDLGTFFLVCDGNSYTLKLKDTIFDKKNLDKTLKEMIYTPPVPTYLGYTGYKYPEYTGYKYPEYVGQSNKKKQTVAVKNEKIIDLNENDENDTKPIMQFSFLEIIIDKYPWIRNFLDTTYEKLPLKYQADLDIFFVQPLSHLEKQLTIKELFAEWIQSDI